MANEWIGIVMEKAPVYAKGALDLTIRKRLELAMIQKRGNIMLNHDGSYEEYYDVDYAEPPVTGFGEGARAVFERRNYLQPAKKNSRGHIATDEMHIHEKALLAHKSSNIVNRYNRIVPKLIDSIKKQIGFEMYVDGGAAGNENKFEGFETFCGHTQCSTADKVAQPNDTYNNLSTALGQAGTWSTDLTTSPNATQDVDWPVGKGDPEYDYWSPKLINYNSTAWGAGFQTWSANCERVLRAAASWLSITVGVDRADLVSLISSELLDEFKNVVAAKGRTLLEHPEARDLGFPDIVNYDGIALQASFGIPAGSAYVFDVGKTQLEFVENQMVMTDGPTWDPNSQSFKFTARSFGNYVWCPKHVAKIADFASA